MYESSLKVKHCCKLYALVEIKCPLISDNKGKREN